MLMAIERFTRSAKALKQQPIPRAKVVTISGSYRVAARLLQPPKRLTLPGLWLLFGLWCLVFLVFVHFCCIKNNWYINTLYSTRKNVALFQAA